MNPEHVIELAHASRDPRTFERSLVTRLQVDFDCDVVLCTRGTRRPPTALGIDIARIPLGSWQTYRGETSPMAGEAARRRGVVIDREVLTDNDRRKCAYFADLMAPVGGTDSLLVYAHFGGHVVGLIVLGKCGRPFTHAAVRACEAIVPALSVSMIAVECAATRLQSDPTMSLTSREREVIDYLRLGYRNAEIALAMDTSPNTVRNQLAAIYQKLGAANRAEAVCLAGAF
jgi:DNA-binding CsgD family transcriptional regulator